MITTRPDREDGIILSFEYPGQVRPLEDVIADEMVDTRNVRCESDHCQTERQRAAQLDSSDDDEGVGPERRFVKRIVRGPDVLCIYFRRNDWQGAKIEDEVDYPENLDLSQHTEEGLPLKYRLFGVAAHSGTIDTGHWIGVVRHRNTRHFRTINDSHVSSKPTASFGDARWPQSMGAKFDPTLLVYVKKEGI